MGSENMIETQDETLQPPQDVPVSGEENSPAQAETTEEPKFYVEIEGDSEQPNQMTERQRYAAWKQEKQKRKAAQKKQLEQQDEIDSLKRELSEMREKVNTVSRGKRPDPYDFDNADDFYEAFEKWQSAGAKPEAKPEQPQGDNTFRLTDEQEWHYERSRQALEGKLPDVKETEGRVKSIVNERFNVDTAFDGLVAISHAFDVDFAKAMYALDKMPGVLDDIQKNVDNQTALGRILRDLESKVKLREEKPIETRPEPPIGGGGQIDNYAARVQQARDAYSASPSMTNWNALQAAKKRK